MPCDPGTMPVLEGMHEESGMCQVFVHHDVLTASKSLELFVTAVVTTMNLKPETRKHKR